MRIGSLLSTAPWAGPERLARVFCAGWLPLCAAALGAGPDAAAPRGAHEARTLLVEVRDAAPGGHPSFDRAADRSYTVSTGGAGDRDEGPGAASNGYVAGAGSGHWSVRAREGERLRVDLPSVQSLQFHVGARPAGAAQGSASKGGAGAVLPSGGVPVGTAPSPGSSVAGVVYFEAVSAFAASFRLQGAKVFVELAPLQAGGVEAPWVAQGPRAPGPLVLEGRVGEWFSLGDTEVAPSRGLSPIAEPPAPAPFWVRVTPVDDRAGERPGNPGAGNATVVGTGQRP
jgi:hypothetical protein